MKEKNNHEKFSIRLLKRFYDSYKKRYGLPREFSEKVAKASAKKLMIVMALLFCFALFKFIFDPNVRNVLSREIYFGSIMLLCAIGFIYAHAIVKCPGLPHFLQIGIGAYGLSFSTGLSIYNMYTSSQTINGFLVLAIVMIFMLTLSNLEPGIFLIIMVGPAIYFLRVLYFTYGMDLFLDVLILFLAIFGLAFVLRRNLVVNYEQESRIIETSLNARAADRSKSIFLARMSHEIRTPINAVLGLDEMIIRESTEDVVRGYAIDIRNAGNTLLSVINDILDFSKIESGKMNLYPVEYNLAFMINELNNMIMARATKKQLKIIHDINPEIPQLLYGDEVRIKQIVLNLLSNAIKYTDDGSVVIEVDCEKIDDKHVELYFSIRDTGRGIREEDLGKFFAPFERIEEQRNNHIEGSGLGVAICKQLLGLMGSEIEVDSTFGEGSAFSFKLVQEVRDWEPIGNMNLDINISSIEEYKPAFIARQAKILAVDDMPINLKVFTNLLKDTQMRIDTCTSGKECLWMAEKERYDMIFLDHMMPDMDGIEVLHHLRTDDNLNYRETPIIILTANAVVGMREKYIQDGFTDYFSKPIIPKRLEQMLMHYLPKHLVECTVENEDDFQLEFKLEKAPSEKKSQLTVQFENLCKIPEFKAREAAAFIGGKYKYVSAVGEFASKVDGHIEQIEKYIKVGHFSGYSFEMQDIRTELGMVGAYDLSEFTRVLGECADSGEVEIVMLRTENLLDGLRTLKAKIEEALSK